MSEATVGASATLAFPNLSAVVGSSVALLLVRHAGGSLDSLCACGEASWRQIGGRDLAACSDAASLPVGLAASNALVALAKQLQVGFLIFAPVLREAFRLHDDELLTSVNTTALKKAFGVLSRKALLAARTDLGGGDASGASQMVEDVKRQFANIATAVANSGADELKALPVPEFFEKRDDGRLKRRGGKKTRQVLTQIAQRKGLLLSDTEAGKLAIANDVRYASEDIQAERLNGRELRALEIHEAQRRLETKKRLRDEEERHQRELGVAAKITGAGEFDDLFSAQL